MHKDWKKIILKSNSTMKEAIKVLNDEALRIIMVVDNNQKLIGTIADGDIRRAIFDHKDMKVHLGEIMHKTPITISDQLSEKQVISLMKEKDVLQIPILDSEGIVMGLKTLQNTYDVEVHENTVFLMAGGFGTRLQPLTENVPKPLLKIGASPILEIILKQLIDSGFRNFVISTHYKAQMLKDYFGDGSKWDVNISYVYEESPLGTAGSLGLLPKKNNDLPVLIMNGDLLTKVDFNSFLNFHNNQNGVASMCVREYDIEVPFGVVESVNQKLTNILEKPTHKFFVNAGIYILSQSLIDKLDGLARIDMTTLLENQIKEGLEVNIFPLHEYWLDIGHLEQFEQANRDSKREFE
jgi:dTDP-glucose pyrophosphorylase/predicted transcriptional regulator